MSEEIINYKLKKEKWKLADKFNSNNFITFKSGLLKDVKAFAKNLMSTHLRLTLVLSINLLSMVR